MTTVLSETEEISATQFKARCLRLLDEVAESGETLIVTKRGRPRVEPASPRPTCAAASSCWSAPRSP